MKRLLKIVSIITIVLVVQSCSQTKNVETDNLFSSRIPDLHFFNINEIIKDRSIYLTKDNDTMFIYKYDTLGRLTQYNYTKVMSRKENMFYFDNTYFPIYKTIRVDYSLSYIGSLIKANNDTIISYWYHEFGDISDTASYVFFNGKVKEIIEPPLNDYDRQKVKKSFFYNNNRLEKIITIPICGEKFDGFGKFDSSTTSFKYVNNLVSDIIERRYYRDKNQNHSNSYYFNDKGFPVKYTWRDTIEFTIK